MTDFCNELERRLVFYLKGNTCAGNGASAQELATFFGTTTVQIRAFIRHLRQDHHIPICSTPRESFFYPRNREEVEATIAQLKSRVREIEKTIEGIEEGIRREFGQLSFDDVFRLEERC